MRICSLFVFLYFPGFVLPQAYYNEDSLIKQLADNSWRAREKAQKTLETNMNVALYCKLRDRQKAGLDAEGDIRILLLMNGFQKKIQAQYKPDLKGYPSFPWLYLDSRYDSYSEWLYEAELQGFSRHGEPYWLGWREATKLWASSKIREKSYHLLRYCKTDKEFNYGMMNVMDEIDLAIAHMIEAEENYWKNRNRENPIYIPPN